MNNEENHGFTSFDFITMMVSFAVIAAVTAPIIKKNFQDDQNIALARQGSSQVGQTLVNPKNLTTLAMIDTKSADRAVASVGSNQPAAPHFDMESLKAHLQKGEWQGDVGKDPWNHPYHFSFLRNKNGSPTHVAVWSDGPNSKNETVATDTSVVSPEAFQFAGDDVGSVIPLR
jgi:hypothetical protein